MKKFVYLGTRDHIQPAKDLCVDSIGVEGTDLFLSPCGNSREWNYDKFYSSGRLETENGLCATMQDPYYGARISMEKCSADPNQVFYNNPQGGFRAASSLNSHNPGKKVYFDGCIGVSDHDAIMVDRSAFGRNDRRFGDNSRNCYRRFDFFPETSKYENYAPLAPMIGLDIGYAPCSQGAPNANQQCNKITGKLECKTNYYGDNCELYLAEDTVTTPIPPNATYTKNDIIKAMILQKCYKGLDISNAKAYCDSIDPNLWNKENEELYAEIEAHKEFLKRDAFARRMELNRSLYNNR